MKISNRFCFVLLVIIGFSCSHDRWDVETQSIDYSAAIARLDKDIFAVNPESAFEEISALQRPYGNFLTLYFRDIMQTGSPDNPMSAQLLMRFTTDPMWEELQRDIELRFTDMGVYEMELGEAFKRYAVHFNQDTLPQLIAYNSGFNIGIYPTRHYLGIGLEWYAGSDLKVVQQLPPDLFPQYKRDKMQPQYLSVNALKGWLMVQHQDQLINENLLGRMIFAGKVLYVSKALMPAISEATLLNFTIEQLEWCEKNEWSIWNNLVEQDMIFTNNPKEINKLMGDGPFTPGMPAESPGGVGNWVAYHIVKSYMDKNQNVTLSALMNQKDDQQFLKTYKPGR
jgi:hypothetical protein